MLIGDLLVVEPGSAKFTKALAAIASVLHPAYEAMPDIKPGISRQSCVLCSLTMRDFLWRVGFKDARVTTCYLALVANDADGKEVWSAGVGDHTAGRVPTRPGLVADLQEGRDRWNGHMIVEVPSEGVIIDATLFHMKRPAWPLLPGMIAAPIVGGPPAYGMERITALGSDQGNGNMLGIWWLREPNERWRAGRDTDRALRLPVVKALRDAFGQWRD